LTQITQQSHTPVSRIALAIALLLLPAPAILIVANSIDGVLCWA
jgi:hypothetical protein